ncbi:hypothetical protein PILCRDRAFT_453786 [Piloderma croceum F 1598]|uniref:Uncharacterized protein n=1 Tax=Piloderma croceum (strain F 1598) TaxID=765440 RepID=A0A0C3FSN8_PILCF|nr:hypothetical protein PILCRDRAFT_453786 [Piloderma croceum F 1598]
MSIGNQDDSCIAILDAGLANFENEVRIHVTDALHITRLISLNPLPDLQFPLLGSHLSTSFNTKPILEDRLHLLETQPRRLRKTEQAEQPPEKTQTCIEPEGTGWGYGGHEREVC